MPNIVFKTIQDYLTNHAIIIISRSIILSIILDNFHNFGNSKK